MLPTLAPLLGAWWVLREVRVPEALAGLLDVLPVATLGLAGLLAWRFHSSRLALTAVVLALADIVLQTVGAQADAVDRDLLTGLVGLVLVVDLVALVHTRERGLLTRWGLLKLAILVAQVPIGYRLLRVRSGELGDLFARAWLPFELNRALPEAVWIAVALAAVLFAWRVATRRSALEAGSLGALLATSLALEQPIGGRAYAIFLSAAGVALLLALIEVSHGLAFRDQLTGLPGRRAFDDALRQVGGRYTVAMVDIDHFKRINDRHGHAVGDQMLRMVAQRLERVTGGGRAFRYGGEEFAVLFPGKAVNQSEPHLEALRRAVGRSRFKLRGADRPRRRPPRAKGRRAASRSLRVTVSIGAAQRDARNAQAQVVVEAADKLLYRAKKAGRNRVKC